MSSNFQYAGGSWIGRKHRIEGRNNQDSWTIVETDGLMIGVIADGCSTTAHSELGSRLGANIVAESVRFAYGSGQRPINWQRLQLHILAQLDSIVTSMGGDYLQTVQDHFFFTFVGCIIDRTQAIFFAFGDGSIVINGVVHALGPFPNNAPPYLGYCLLGDAVNMDPELLVLRPVIKFPDVSELNSFMLASDGIDDLIISRDLLRPGLKVPVGPIDQFWTDDICFSNKIEVTRRLKLISRDFPEKNPEFGHLSDDTTLIVGRRRSPTIETE